MKPIPKPRSVREDQEADCVATDERIGVSAGVGPFSARAAATPAITSREIAATALNDFINASQFLAFTTKAAIGSLQDQLDRSTYSTCPNRHAHGDLSFSESLSRAAAKFPTRLLR